MLNKPKTCSGCSLETISRGFSVPDGSGNLKVLILGEALGEREYLDGKPFRPWAEAGSVLQTAIKKVGLQREDFLFYNLIQCQPPYNFLDGAPYEYSAISHCQVHLKKVISKYQPKAILCLGNLPLRYLSEEVYNYRISILNRIKESKDTQEKRILRKQLSKLLITSMRGYRLDSIYGIPLVASLHPSYINRTGRTYLGVLARDLWFAVELAKGEIGKFEYDYIEASSEEEIENFYLNCKQNEKVPIAYDIETPYSVIEVDETDIEYKDSNVRDIISIQFSNKSGTGIFINWNEITRKWIEKILSLPNPKIGWNNWEFDQTNIEYHLGKEVIKGDNVDVMWFWKHLNSDFGSSKLAPIGKALQFATNFYTPSFLAWKHINEEEPIKYGVMDVDATIRTYNGIVKDTKDKRFLPNTKSLYEGFMDDVVKLRPILQFMEGRGIPRDKEEIRKFRKLVKEEMERTLDELQSLFPFHLRNVTPTEGYVHVPPEVSELMYKFDRCYRNINSNNYSIFVDEREYDFALSVFIEKNTRRKTEKRDESGLVYKEFDIEGFKVKRWCRVEKFKPNSNPQVLRYIEWKEKTNKKYKVPKEKGKKTTSKDKLQILADQTGDQLLRLRVYYLELRKLMGTYVKGKFWKVQEDGRTYTTFSNKPATGQLASPTHNSPARGTRFSSKGYLALAKQFRKTICASQGKVLLSADWKSFHALTLGFEAEDANYIRLVRLDVHSFVAAFILRDELRIKYDKNLVLKGGKLVAKAFENENDEEAVSKLDDLDNWINLPNAELGANLAWVKKNHKFIRDSQAKPAILGIGFGMEVDKFYKLNMYSFNSIEQPRRIFLYLNNLFPPLFTYQDYIRDKANENTYLISRYGYIRRFWDVYDYRMLKEPRTPRNSREIITKDKYGQWWVRVFGSQAKEAVAFLPANDAFGKKKEAMRDLWYYEKDGIIQNKVTEFGMFNELHDDLMFEIEDNDSTIEEATKVVKEVMERPATMLINSVAPEGLKCEVDVKVGRNWSDMKEIRL